MKALLIGSLSVLAGLAAAHGFALSAFDQFNSCPPIPRHCWNFRLYRIFRRR